MEAVTLEVQTSACLLALCWADGPPEEEQGNLSCLLFDLVALSEPVISKQLSCCKLRLIYHSYI